MNIEGIKMDIIYGLLNYKVLGDKKLSPIFFIQKYFLPLY